MGTRSIWTFTDTRTYVDARTKRKRSHTETFHVYKHWDGYPSGAAQILGWTLLSDRVWEMPRFEPDEFAAGFIAANKDEAGGFRLAATRYGACDVEFGYTVYMKDVHGHKKLHVRAVETNYWDVENAKTGKGTSEGVIYDGPALDWIVKTAHAKEVAQLRGWDINVLKAKLK